jgi:hypothetical protein
MAYALALIVLNSVGFLLSSCSPNTDLQPYQGVAADSPKRSGHAGEAATREADKHIESLVLALSFKEDRMRSDAERQLLEMARTSPDKRKLVINELLKSVGTKEELNGSHSILKTTFAFWSSATNIFAELKASESLDVMIRCLHCGNGLTGNMGEPPAAYALFRMGELAVPKLSEALLHNPNGYVRIQSALCLGRIGGPQAELALRNALRTEKEKDVRDYISFVLNGAD